MNTAEKVIEILREQSGQAEISSEDGLQDDLGLDSLGMVTLLVQLEDVFQIELEESDLNPFDLNTVSDVIRLADRYCGEKA